MEPLPKRLLDNIKERLRVEWLMNTTIRDVIFHMFYVSVVITMVHGHRNIYSSFLCTEAVRSLFVKPSIGMKMGKVSNTDDFEKYLHSTFIPAMTDITSDHDYATRGSNHYLVGTYRLRQLRIKTDVCAPIMYGLPRDCKGPYSVTEEETRYFDQSWSKPLTGVDATNVDDKSDHWKYRSTWDLKTLPFPGTHGTYSGGGYVLQLPAKVSTHSDILSGLFADKWIDQYTRAIFHRIYSI
ncbi:polycystin-2-like protein 1 [Ruditapes philippinarum]|uniref:polycystin-2-like protein 1 n=1 Tax=Ruditapes philippinarum TaxID=129788 RepID=UPI00295C37E5|nr:polycystin-2-like protein 1 [Ruditapes philippinarum]